ncbi:MAG TPA: hypothetical protein VF145_01020, partial [Chitinophagaceae bacterium]
MKLRWLLTLIIIAFGCTSGNAQKDPKIRGVRDSTRLYYDYNRKSLYIKNSNGNIELSQALPHKSGKTIKIEVINYNPLKTQLSFGDTSSSYFLADTATFSRYITL